MVCGPGETWQTRAAGCGGGAMWSVGWVGPGLLVGAVMRVADALGVGDGVGDGVAVGLGELVGAGVVSAFFDELEQPAIRLAAAVKASAAAADLRIRR